MYEGQCEMIAGMKRLCILFWTIIIICCLGGCGAVKESPRVVDRVVAKPDFEDESSNEEELEFPLVLRVGYSTNEQDPRGVALKQFKNNVESKTRGKIMIEIHPDGELGSDSELLASMITGDVDMTVSSAGNYAAYATRMGVSALPFMFDDFESAWNFMNSDIMDNISVELEDYNMHVLAYFDNGFRCVTTSEKVGPIEYVSDMDGLNIRTPDNQIVMETMSELKANPRSYPFAELKKALKNGTFDAQENPIPVIYNNKLYEVQKYLSITNHSYDAMPLTIRYDIWTRLGVKYQIIISEAAQAAMGTNRNLVKKQTQEYVEKLKDEGMEVNYPDIAPFKNATSGVLNVFKKVYGSELVNYLQSNK